MRIFLRPVILSSFKRSTFSTRVAGEVDSEDEEEEDLRASIRSRVKGAATQVRKASLRFGGGNKYHAFGLSQIDRWSRVKGAATQVTPRLHTI